MWVTGFDVPAIRLSSHRSMPRLTGRAVRGTLGRANDRKLASDKHGPPASAPNSKVSKGNVLLQAGPLIPTSVSHSTSPAPLRQTLFNRPQSSSTQTPFSTRQSSIHRTIDLLRNCLTRFKHHNTRTNKSTIARDVANEIAFPFPDSKFQHHQYEADRLFASPPLCRHGHRCR